MVRHLGGALHESAVSGGKDGDLELVGVGQPTEERTMKSGTDLINEAKTRIREVDSAEALRLHAAGTAVFLDVRDQQEVNLGMIPGAVHVSRGNLETKIEAVVPRDADVVRNTFSSLP